jgi:hypothetical protein
LHIKLFQVENKNVFSAEVSGLIYSDQQEDKDGVGFIGDCHPCILPLMVSI